jgi:hypothetical protein
VGVDGTYGIERFSFGIDTLRDGIEYSGRDGRRLWIGRGAIPPGAGLHVADAGKGRQDRNEAAVDWAK